MQRCSIFLIVEDRFVDRRLLVHILSRYGTCDIAADGEEALQMYRDSLGSAQYDAIFLDLMLPVIDGFGVLSGISGLGGKVPPVFIVSSASSQETIESATAMKHVSAFLSKPYTVKTVDELLERHNLIEPPAGKPVAVVWE